MTKTVKIPIDLIPRDPRIPPEFDSGIVSALQSMNRGEATPAQQQRLLKWMIHDLCCTYHLGIHRGIDAERDDCFAGGKRFCGKTLVDMISFDLIKFASKEKKHDGTNPGSSAGNGNISAASGSGGKPRPSYKPRPKPRSGGRARTGAGQ